MNPAKQNSIFYNLNRAQREIKPGRQHTLSTGASWLVEFDRGGSFGAARYQLTSGIYTFVETSQGWNLVKKSPRDSDAALRRPAIEDEANLQRR